MSKKKKQGMIIFGKVIIKLRIYVNLYMDIE